MKSIAWALILLGACSAPPLPAPPREYPAPAALPLRPELPDPLVSFVGKRISSRAEWETQRKPELKALFQHYMYGILPPVTEVSAAVRRTDPAAFGGKATLREVSLTIAGPKGPRIDLLLVVPNQRRGPAPVFVGLNFTGNHSLVTDPAVALPTSWMRGGGKGEEVVNNRATDRGRGKNAGTWALEQSIDRGYAVATVYYGDIFPDKPEFSDGVFPQFHEPKEGQKTPGDTGCGAIAMWAWGIHRIIDYLVTVPELDRSKIAVTGHSRLGKTALLAAAFDERIALAIPHQAGCGGTAPSRTKNPKAESVKRINSSFPHWFDDHFKQFNEDVDRLPFDQNCLLALCAPRPVLYTNGIEDQWANPDGQFEMAKAAAPVYRLYGVDALSVTERPPVGQLVDGALGYYLRTGPHVSDPDYWKTFLDYADRHFRT
ncbi:MAG TPA: acetylxylan esterase [Planctomycetota bacterium]|nr:acetylxylan esterase [Planctomycetota bacterium]